MKYLVLALLLVSSPAYAQSRTTAAHISDAFVWSNVTLDTIHSLRAPDRKHALLSQACRVGLTVGVTEAVKRIVKRERPDHSDHLSFWSGHTAMAAQASGWNFSFGIPITVGTAWGRVHAKRHWVTDTLAGGAWGFTTQAVCR